MPATSNDHFAAHDQPVWRDRANFLIQARIDAEGSPRRFEQLWARQMENHRFEICCIPFFLYNVSLGDVVEKDTNTQLVRVVEPSGRFVFRVWFGESFHPRGKVVDELTDLAALSEWYSANLLAVDAADEDAAQLVADYLAEEERAGRLIYETGRL
jgi:Domain of unknown function (DUF4265)